MRNIYEFHEVFHNVQKRRLVYYDSRRPSGHWWRGHGPEVRGIKEARHKARGAMMASFVFCKKLDLQINILYNYYEHMFWNFELRHKGCV